MREIILATRKSQLALWQADCVLKRINSRYDNIKATLCPISTSGDKRIDVELFKIGGKRLFIKELEYALVERRAHLAVHSLKDVPVDDFSKTFKIVSVLKREDRRDMFLSQKYKSIDDLPKGAVVGTSSLRRRMQLLIARDDLKIKNIRGNVNTRISKLNSVDFDAIILAKAGVSRLKLQNKVKYLQVLDNDMMIPAMGQGVIALECMVKDKDTAILSSFLNDRVSSIETSIERAFLKELVADCKSPVGISVKLHKGYITLRAIVGLFDGSQYIKKKMCLAIDDNPCNIGKNVAQSMIEDGAMELLKRSQDMLSYK